MNLNSLRRIKQRHQSLVGPPEMYEPIRKFQIDFLKNRGLEPTHTYLDFGCGVLRGGIPLIKYLKSGNYVGFDIRKTAINHAYIELVYHSCWYKWPNLFYEPEKMIKKFGSKVDMGMAFSVFFHLDDENLRSSLKLISDCLISGGIFYANVNIGNDKGENWFEFPVVWRTEQMYEEEAKKVGLSIERIDNMKNLGLDSTILTQDDQVMYKFTKD